MATKKTSSKKSALKLVKASKTTTDRDALIQEVLDAISWNDMSAEAPPTDREGDGVHADNKFLVNNHFAYNASQVNVDLALAADCEFSRDFSADDDSEYNFYCSSEYEKLRQTFLDELRGAIQAKLEKEPHVDPLLRVVVRAYNAGRLCPERREPDSAHVRRERIRRRDERRKEEQKRRIAATGTASLR
jgi:hypothetical protein